MKIIHRIYGIYLTLYCSVRAFASFSLLFLSNDDSALWKKISAISLRMVITGNSDELKAFQKSNRSFWRAEKREMITGMVVLIGIIILIVFWIS